jgi:ribonuclease T
LNRPDPNETDATGNPASGPDQPAPDETPREPTGATADAQPAMAGRFRGFLPVVVDVETGGFSAATDALLEIAAVPIEMDGSGRVSPGETHRLHVQPFEGANIEQAALDVNGIDPFHPLRPALPEKEALQSIFLEVRRAVRAADCTRAILVGHNAFFDLSFLNAAVARCGIKRNPFHPFSCFDTVTLGGVAYGQTVLSRIAQAANLDFDTESAHSAGYDATITARIFCMIVNQFGPAFEANTTPAGTGRGEAG